MANKLNKKSTVYQSPVGELMWAKLLEPGKDGYDKDKYACDLVLSGSEAKDFKGIIDKEMQRSKVKMAANNGIDTSEAEAGNPPYRPEGDDLIFKFKTSAYFDNKETGSKNKKIIRIYDSAGNLITDKISVIGNGSKARIKFKVIYTEYQSAAYVRLVPIAVQVIDWKGMQSDFDSVEGGFIVEGNDDFEVKNVEASNEQGVDKFKDEGLV